MKRVLLSLIILLSAVSLSAKITVYEYNDDKAYCTFEFDSELKTDSSQIRGTYRALDFYNIPYFEMTFVARSYVDEAGKTIISITPIFYYHSYLSKVIGQREAMDPEAYALKFELVGNVITDITSDSEKKKVFNKAAFPEKGFVEITNFPESFTKAKSMNWGKYPKALRKSLQDKDRTMGRKY